MTKEEIYLDLSKLSEEQQKEIIGMLPKTASDIEYEADTFYHLLHFAENRWFVDCVVSFKQEITYEQFKTLINEYKI